MDSIVTQMIQVADYLGWDITELRPVSLGTIASKNKNIFVRKIIYL